MIVLVSHVGLCSDHFALVFVQCPPPGLRLSFESRGEGAGGDIPLQNSESLSASENEPPDSLPLPDVVVKTQ